MTITPPEIVRTEERHAAVIHHTVTIDEMKRLMGPTIAELMSALSAQGATPVGSLFNHYYSMKDGVWDFDVGVPVASPVTAAGRMRPGSLPAATVARTVYSGGYDGLYGAWMEFEHWLHANGHTGAGTFWESYLTAPESGSDPAAWKTELNKIVQR